MNIVPYQASPPSFEAELVRRHTVIHWEPRPRDFATPSLEVGRYLVEYSSGGQRKKIVGLVVRQRNDLIDPEQATKTQLECLLELLAKAATDDP